MKKNIILYFVIFLALLLVIYSFSNIFKPVWLLSFFQNKSKDQYFISQKLLKKYPINYDIDLDMSSDIEILRARNTSENLKILDEISENILDEIQVLELEDGTLFYYKIRPISIWYSFDNDKGEEFYFVNCVTYYNNMESGDTEYSMSGHLVYTKRLTDGMWVYLGSGQESPENILCSTLNSWGVPDKYKCLENISTNSHRSGIDFEQRQNIVF